MFKEEEESSVKEFILFKNTEKWWKYYRLENPYFGEGGMMYHPQKSNNKIKWKNEGFDNLKQRFWIPVWKNPGYAPTLYFYVAEKTISNF